MPVFNAGRFIEDSIKAILRQSFGEFELLVIDDGSTDESLQKARSFRDPRVRILENGRNLGIVETLNRGLSEADSPWVARCDADDISHPQRLEKQHALAMAEAGIVFVGSGARIVDERGRTRGFARTASSHGAIRWDLCFRNPFAHSAAFFLREGAEYRPVRAAEDYDLWSRMSRVGRLAAVPAAMVDYRQHPDSIMARHGADISAGKNEEVLKIMRENIRSVSGRTLSGAEIERLASGWIFPPETREGICSYWQDYAALLGDKRKGDGMDLVVSEHLFTKFCQYRKRGFSKLFLSSLPGFLFRRMPLFRTLLSFGLPV